MVNIKVKFKPSLVEGKYGVIYYQISHNRVSRQVSTRYNIFSHEWSDIDRDIIVEQPQSARTMELRLMRDKIRIEVKRLYLVAREMTERGADCEELVDECRLRPHIETLFEYFRAQIARLETLERRGTAYNYHSTLRSFERFRNGEDLVTESITAEMVEEYEAYLKHDGLSMNSTSFYMRILRAVYNKAVEAGLAEQRHPFKRVYTGIEKTIKRALTLKDISQLKGVDLSDNKRLEYARDLFMFSFYTRGMSFIDIAYLRKTDLKNGVLIYRRRKTGQILHIRWERCMEVITSRYSDKDSPYLLSILNSSEDTHRLYRLKLGKINNALKALSRDLALRIPLTMYVARHSWASIARSKNIPVSVISEGMGHDSESTTQIYLASLDTTVIDRANSIIIKSVGM